MHHTCFLLTYNFNFVISTLIHSNQLKAQFRNNFQNVTLRNSPKIDNFRHLDLPYLKNLSYANLKIFSCLSHYDIYHLDLNQNMMSSKEAMTFVFEVTFYNRKSI